MSLFQIGLATVCAITLFLYAIDNFSREIQQVSGESFRKFLTKGTRHPLLGLGLGALVTSVIQSSTATSVIAVGLVNAGMLSFKSSLGIIFGANIGTTVTAQLVAFKLTDVAPAFIVVGFFLSLVRTKFSFVGKSVFFFGFVFFTLNLIATSIKPLQTDPDLLAFLASANDPLTGVLAGAAFTALVQSSSVTTGLAVVMLQGGLMPFDSALPVILGANIGTTVTALIASFKMDTAGKRTALSHFIYNTVGVLIFLPAVMQIPRFVEIDQASAAHTLANVHLVFNLATAMLFVALVSPFAKLLERIVPSAEDEFTKPITLPDVASLDSPGVALTNLDEATWKLLDLLGKNYNLVTLAIETKEEGLLRRCVKNQTYLALLQSEIQDYLSQIATSIENEDDSRQLVRLANRVDYLFQVSDSIEDLIQLNERMNERRAPLTTETIMQFREMSSAVLKLFKVLADSMGELDQPVFSKSLRGYESVVDQTYEMLLKNMSIKGDRNAVHLERFVSLNQRIKDKLNTFFKLSKNRSFDALPGKEEKEKR